MTDRLVSWLVYTCLIGVIPMVARLLVFTVTTSGVEPLAIGDLVAFGLVLHSANINEISKLPESQSIWKAIQNGASIFFLFMYALILFTTILPDKRIVETSILHASIGMTAASFLLSLAVYQRARVEKSEAE